MIQAAAKSLEAGQRREPARWSAVAAVVRTALAVWGAVAALMLLFAPRLLLPAEDAFILFQYSRNLAHTGAITYIAHGPHAEGATDFAWMALVAAGIRLHVPPFWLVSVVSCASLFLLVLLVLCIANVRATSGRVLAGVGVMTLMPQFLAATAGFSAIPFACLIAGLGLVVRRGDRIAAPLLALALCLLRPDGIVFAAPLLLLALWLHGDRPQRLAWDAALFVLPGLAYFVWRWHYFGLLLPLPFYVKSAVHRTALIFVRTSILSGGMLLLFALGLLWLAFRGVRRSRETRGLMLCLIAVPTLFYLSMRLDQNIGHRFFVYLPVGAAVAIASMWGEVRPRANQLLLGGLALWVVFVLPVWLDDADETWQHQMDERVALSREMSALPHGTLLTTEAGILPYESHWAAYDPWGLNTAQFARRLLQPEDVAALRPDVILALPSGSIEHNDACVVEPEWKAPYADRSWANMVRNLVAGTPTDEYDLRVLPFGNLKYRAHYGIPLDHGGNECWMVRRDSPLHDQMIGLLDSHHALSGDAYRSLLAEREQAERSAPRPVIHRDLKHYRQVIFGRIHDWFQD